MFQPKGLPVDRRGEARWLVSGHAVYDYKQGLFQQHALYFSTSVLLEPDARLETTRVSSLPTSHTPGRQTHPIFPDRILAIVHPEPRRPFSQAGERARESRL